MLIFHKVFKQEILHYPARFNLFLNLKRLSKLFTILVEKMWMFNIKNKELPNLSNSTSGLLFYDIHSNFCN